MKGDKNAGPRFIRKTEDFRCSNCGAIIKGNGYTDHCPKCLRSKHVDIMPGDRKSECGGLMVPVGASHDRKGFIIAYTCKKCGIRKRVKAAPEDDKESIMALFGARQS